MTAVVGARHGAGVDRLVCSYHAIPSGSPVRLAKRTSNLFRARSATDVPGLDTSGLTGVVDVDPVARTADVQGMCTYEDLVDATLPHGLSPLVVPQLKTITLGGAVTGLGIESTSFRNGLPHESVLEMDVLTGNGEVVTADPHDRHPDLYRGFANSYGTLGYATRLRIELEPVGRTVSLRHVRFHDIDALLGAVGEVMDTGAWDGEDVDYLDGVVFGLDEAYLVLGLRSDRPGPTSDYTGGSGIFYRSIQHDSAGPTRDLLTTHDYLWRWDTDWFWCSRAFGAQNPVVRRLWPRRWLRSSVYWRLVALDRRFDVADRLEALKRQPPRERVVQDVEIPLDATGEFLRWFLREVPIEPVWLCPLRLRADHSWTLYPLEPGERYVNVGFWSTVPVTPGDPAATNRAVEDRVSSLGGHKSLYSEAFYDEETFWRHYGGADYPALKERYDPGHRLPDLYAKAVRGA